MSPMWLNMLTEEYQQGEGLNNFRTIELSMGTRRKLDAPKSSSAHKGREKLSRKRIKMQNIRQHQPYMAARKPLAGSYLAYLHAVGGMGAKYWYKLF